MEFGGNGEWAVGRKNEPAFHLPTHECWISPIIFQEGFRPIQAII